MPKYKQPKKEQLSIQDSWQNEGEIGLTRALIMKYAKVLDMTDSGRDIKPLATGMLEAVDRLKSLEAQQGKQTESSPLMKILGEANG